MTEPPATRTAMTMTRVTWCVFAVGSLWLVAHATGLLGPLAELTYPLLSLGSVVAIVIGVRVNRPTVRQPWILLTGGMFLFFVGGVTRTAMGTLGVITAQRSIVPDLITIPGYFLAAAGFFAIVHARQRGRDSEIDTLLDAAVSALAAMALGWLFLLNPSQLQHSPLSVRLILATYPTLSVLLVALAASIAFSSGSRRIVANNLLVGSMLSVLIGDVVYTFAETHAVHVPSTLVDVPYGFGFLFFVLTMLHPSMREVTEPVPAAESTPTIGRLVVVAVALAVPGHHHRGPRRRARRRPDRDDRHRALADRGGDHPPLPGGPGARALRGPARAPGDARPPDRAAEPRLRAGVRRPAAPDRDPSGARRADVPRRRPLQARERQLRAHAGRRLPRVGRPAAAREHPPVGPGGPDRRRRVRRRGRRASAPTPRRSSSDSGSAACSRRPSTCAVPS